MLKIAASLVLSALAGSAGAVTLLTASLADANENPPTSPTTTTGAPRPASFGTASFVINDAMTAMTFTATIFNIDVTGSQTPDSNDNLINAHIHAGPAVTPTMNGPVVWGFFGSPFNDNNPNDAVVTPLATGVGGTFSGKWDLNEGNATTFAAQLANILAGRSYINFHTNQFTGGEIRGNLVVAVPEPETWALLLAGLAVVSGVGRQRARRPLPAAA
ncbi:MAG TPA: CHRD domain-containing protein [Caldimonas sp.]|jgi:hypothetical protein|nr:CHRD domain-containing protein [Caldimonas sp.]